jgi:hypothetical protein
VLTAGHCIFDFGGAGWVDEVWVYPAWDGAGDITPAPTFANHYGWGRGTAWASWTGWTQNGDWNYDLGIIAIDRAVGALTGWFGWHWGGDCDSYWLAQTVHNASYPAESCGSPGLHNGRDMTYWFGNFDSCPDVNRIRLTTVPGCYNAIWGGQSGSGVYRIDGDNRLVHAITSTSNRTTTATYTRQWEAWVDYNQNDFIPNWGRGAAFDLEPLDLHAGPAAIPAGGSTNLLNHLAVNRSNAAANDTWRFNVYLSSNDNISTADTLLSQQQYNWNFGPVSSVRLSMAQVTIPADTPPGSYYIGVIYDAGTDGNAARPSRSPDNPCWPTGARTLGSPSGAWRVKLLQGDAHQPVGAQLHPRTSPSGRSSTRSARPEDAGRRGAKPPGPPGGNLHEWPGRKRETAGRTRARWKPLRWDRGLHLVSLLPVEHLNVVDGSPLRVRALGRDGQGLAVGRHHAGVGRGHLAALFHGAFRRQRADPLERDDIHVGVARDRVLLAVELAGVLPVHRARGRLPVDSDRHALARGLVLQRDGLGRRTRIVLRLGEVELPHAEKGVALLRAAPHGQRRHDCGCAHQGEGHASGRCSHRHLLSWNTHL